MVSEWATGQAAQCWCRPETEHINMDIALVTVFAELLDETRAKPRLGYATTAELIDEVRTRIKPDGMLGYSTVSGEEYERMNQRTNLGSHDHTELMCNTWASTPRDRRHSFEWRTGP